MPMPRLAAFVELDGTVQTAPAPRFLDSPAVRPCAPRTQDASARLAAWGCAEATIAAVMAAGAAG